MMSMRMVERCVFVFWSRVALWGAAVAFLITPMELSGQDWNVAIHRAGNGEVFLDWAPLDGAVGYRVEYRESLDTGNWAPLPPAEQWPTLNTSILIAGSDPGHFYRVVALMGERQGQLIELLPIDSYTVSELAVLFGQAGFPVQPEYGVDAFKVLYRTLDPQGNLIQASGAIMVPRDLVTPLPWMSYQHGTIVLKDDVPSRGENLEYYLGLVFASLGYITSEPDYIGLGDSPGLHPYMHAETEALSAVDLIRATQQVAADHGLAWDDRLFLSGYSQGGHATMAMHQMIQEELAGEFEVTASSPMAGPHDVSGTMFNLMTANAPTDAPYYLPYVLFSYQSAYNLYDDVSEVLKEPYATTLPPLFDGTHSGGEIDNAMPAIPREILQDELLADILANPEHPFRLALADNDTYLWAPASALRMYHCGMDTTVPKQNSLIAYQYFMQEGVSPELVQLMDPFGFGSHSSCIPFAFLAAKNWFDSLK